MRIEHEELIAAPIATVWNLTERVEDWPTLSTAFARVRRLDDGPLRVGSRARVHQPGTGARVWTVTALRPPWDQPPRQGAGTTHPAAGEPTTSDATSEESGSPATFAWETRLLGVRAIATHLLAATPEGCRNTLILELRGPGAGLLGRIAGERMQAALASENAGLKRAAELREAGAT